MPMNRNPWCRLFWLQLLCVVGLGFVFAGGTGVSFAAEVDDGVAGKNIRTLQFDSPSLNEKRFVNILLPLDYEASTERYPVLYLLHGLGDKHTAWSLMTNLSGYAQKMKLIVVMPDAGRSFYANSAADPKARFEDMIIKDLVPFVDGHFRTIPLPRSRAVAGLSMGGYGAVFLGLKHFDQFAAIGCFSGAVAFPHNDPPSEEELAKPDRQWEKPLQALLGPKGSAARQERDPFLLLEKVPMPQMPALYIACGGQDFLLDQNRAFVDLLSKKKIAYEYREISPRVHSWDFWDDQIQEFFKFLKPLKGFSGI